MTALRDNWWRGAIVVGVLLPALVPSIPKAIPIICGSLLGLSLVIDAVLWLRRSGSLEPTDEERVP